MLYKLEQIGVHGVELEWFASYLEGRRQRTKFKDSTSEEIDVDIGLPQGTALSVISFILYIDSITDVPKNGSLILFADDTMLVIKSNDIESAINDTNDDLNRLYNHLNVKKLKLNRDKTKWMLISKGNRHVTNCPLVIKIEDDIIQRVSSIEYLDVTLDDKLIFDEQVKMCVKKSASKVNFLKRIGKKLPFESKKLVYNAIIQPQFEYCSTIYFNCTKQQIDNIQKIQNRALRCILNCENTCWKR